MLGRTDEELLATALIERRAIVTYNLRTFPPLLKRLAEIGTQRAGVVLVSVRTVPLGDVRLLASALARRAKDNPQGLMNQVLFLA